MPGRTTLDGYGWTHQQDRAQLLRDHVDGDLCDRCWQPMYTWQPLDAAHPHDRPVALHPDSRADHLEHTACNRGHIGEPGRPDAPRPRRPPRQRRTLNTTRDW